MADSKRKTFLNYLRDTTLAAIQKTAGYNFDVGLIERGLKEIDAVNDSQFPALFIARVTDERENLTQIEFISRTQVVIVGYVKNSTGIDGVQQDLDDIIEDVTKAIETDRTLGGTVKETEIKRVVTDEGDMEAVAAFAMTVEFMYPTTGVIP